MKELLNSSIVVDADGNQWDLEGGAREEYSQGTPKKLLEKFASGFPKSWARGTAQVRKRVQLAHDLKDVSWLDLPFVGIEYSAIAEIRTEPFAFPHLVRELRQGVLNKPYPIYLFQCAQPCWNEATRTMKVLGFVCCFIAFLSIILGCSKCRTLLLLIARCHLRTNSHITASSWPLMTLLTCVICRRMLATSGLHTSQVSLSIRSHLVCDS